MIIPDAGVNRFIFSYKILIEFIFIFLIDFTSENISKEISPVMTSDESLVNLEFSFFNQ